MIEERHQVRVVAFVVNDEASIDRHQAAPARGVDGVGMTADPRVLLVNGDPVSLVEQPSRRHTGDAGADDGYG